MPELDEFLATEDESAPSRRDFFTRMLAGLSVLKLETASGQQSSTGPFLERSRPGTPHRGKVLAAIQPHSDDIALLCAGTVAKLIQEGYTGYMIRATNDDMGDDVGEPGGPRDLLYLLVDLRMRGAGENVETVRRGAEAVAGNDEAGDAQCSRPV